MRASFMTRRLSVGPVLGARVPRTQMAPSSRWGRNSEPMTPLKARKTASRSDERRADGDPCGARWPTQPRCGSGR